ncbi:MAG: hypothetical protein QNI87_12500 [Erythrobacter sp.]|uniref:hypothetical protein n=1 Tax=Erythrobacter sp. TaxID=1042 RepID=UPI002633C52D|nr:hypothetical protein [Erythrobacter sp.]MDJ0979338.1 hypothetical protein [Erythrobacter sp.]
MSDDTLTHAVEPASSYIGRGGEGSLKLRFAGLAATIVVELLIIALLLTLGWNLSQEEPEAPVVTRLEARNASDDSPPAAEEQPQQVEPEPRAEPEPRPPEPQEIETPEPPLPTPTETPPLILPNAPPLPPPPPPPPPRPKPPEAKPQGPPARVYGPPDSGSSSRRSDSRRVGTAPNGEPMYAARWYREPTRQELAGYLSTAIAPASALIVCRTVSDFRVEDCQLLGESPRGSKIGRAVLAAAWQFRVRPAIIRGQSQVGSWVRIRIDYTRTVQR